MVENGKRKGLSPLVIVLIVLNVVLAVCLALSLRTALPARQAALTEAASQTMSQAELESHKLRQEIRQLEIENDRQSSPWQTFSSFATLLTAIVAVAGVFLTIWKQFLERERDREQREAESRRCLDEKFSSIISDIGSDNPSLQVSAAISLITFLRAEYSAFHEQVYLILLANLKIKHNQQVNRLLIQVFEKAVRLKLEAMRKIDDSQRLDLTSTNLYRIDLSGLDLSNADIAFSTLELANLDSSNLSRVKGYEVSLEKAKLTDAFLTEARLAKANLKGAHLHRANLVSANLKETRLNGTQFFQAKLQSAHLENAELFDAKFEQADLNDTYFQGAKYNDQTLKSIIKAHNWEKAHYDEDVLFRLTEIQQNYSP
ncbi:MAG: pentapeptide repeat-containing protein [Anaerolineales bacterium]|nr:pentapeptide repeat-containing protein [Anaerolineales bacterium]